MPNPAAIGTAICMLLRYQPRTRRVHLEIGEYCRTVRRAPKSDIESEEVWQNDEGQDD